MEFFLFLAPEIFKEKGIFFRYTQKQTLNEGISMKRILLLILIACVFDLFADSVEEQLNSAGFTDVKKYFETRRVKKTTPVIDGNSKASKTIKEVNKVYSDLYDITPAEEKEIPEKVDIYYFPGLLSPSFYGLTGLSETITANTLGKGKYRVSGRFQYKKITKSFNKTISGKADVVSYPVDVTMGIIDNFEIGFSLPINSWDIDAAGIEPKKEKETAVGDPILLGKFRIPLDKKSSTGMALVAGFKFPSGDGKRLEADGSTGQTDFTMMAVMSSKMGLANAHVNIGYTFTGDPEFDDANYFSDDKVIFRFGFDYSRNENITISLEFAGEDSGKNGTKMEIIPGARAMLTKDTMIDVSMPIDVHNSEYYGYKFRLSAGMNYLF